MIKLYPWGGGEGNEASLGYRAGRCAGGGEFIVKRCGEGEKIIKNANCKGKKGKKKKKLATRTLSHRLGSVLKRNGVYH